MKRSIREKGFLTGADGMLGASICRELIAQDYSIKAMVLPNRNLNNLAACRTLAFFRSLSRPPIRDWYPNIRFSEA